MNVSNKTLFWIAIITIIIIALIGGVFIYIYVNSENQAKDDALTMIWICYGSIAILVIIGLIIWLLKILNKKDDTMTDSLRGAFDVMADIPESELYFDPNQSKRIVSGVPKITGGSERNACDEILTGLTVKKFKTLDYNNQLNVITCLNSRINGDPINDSKISNIVLNYNKIIQDKLRSDAISSKSKLKKSMDTLNALKSFTSGTGLGRD